MHFTSLSLTAFDLVPTALAEYFSNSLPSASKKSNQNISYSG
nr:MAG TPA: hypothetical protein [Caudoviricetes sp.]